MRKTILSTIACFINVIFSKSLGYVIVFKPDLRG